jgi:hypothetical protein
MSKYLFIYLFQKKNKFGDPKLNISEFWELRISYTECIIYFWNYSNQLFVWQWTSAHRLWIPFSKISTSTIIIISFLFFSQTFWEWFDSEYQYSCRRLDMGFSSVGHFY